MRKKLSKRLDGKRDDLFKERVMVMKGITPKPEDSHFKWEIFS